MSAFKTSFWGTIVLTMCLNSCSSQSSSGVLFIAEQMATANTAEYVFLNGPVKEATATTVLATIDYGGMASISYRTDDLGAPIIKYEFDENGNVTSWRDYDSKGDFIRGYTYINEYNKDHTVKKRTISQYFGTSDYQLTWYVDYEYSNKKPTKVTVSIPYYDRSGDVKHTTILEYNQGQVSKLVTRSSDEEAMNIEYNVTYKKNYFIINGNENVKYDRISGRIIDYNGQFQLDDAGRIISCKNLQASPFDTPWAVFSDDIDCSNVYYKYDKFDEYGNWTVRIMCLGEARIPTYVVERVITYYK